MTKKSVGYPLPSGEAYTDELACMMIFIPDKDEYRQAFFSSFFYLSNWIAWENDPDKRGKDAARAWKLAVEATLECIEMNTCETILSLLTEIRDNTGVYCCPEIVDISDGDRFTDEVEDGVGDVPQNIIDAGYATGVSDWVGYAEYKCMISHIMINNMTAQLEKILSYMIPPSAILGGIPTLAAVLMTIMIDFLSVLVYSIALGASVSVKLNAALALLSMDGLESLIEDMAEHHDALACAIYNADGIDGAIVALREEIDALFPETRAVVLRNLNLDAQLKALYAGRYDAQDIAETLADQGFDVLDYDCTCPAADESYQAEFLEDRELWETQWDAGWNGVRGTPLGCMRMNYANGDLYVSVGQLQAGAGISEGDDIEIVLITMNYWRALGSNPPGVKVTIDADGTPLELFDSNVAVDTWSPLEFRPVTPKLVEHNAQAVIITCEGGVGGNGYVDSVYVWFNVI